MLIRLILIIFLFIITGCKNEEEIKVIVPEFSILIKTTDELKKELETTNETVQATIIIDGNGVPFKGIKSAPNRDVVLCVHKEIINIENIISFSGLFIPQNLYDRLSDKNYYITINIASINGKYNIIENGYASFRLSEIKSTPLSIFCNLL